MKREASHIKADFMLARLKRLPPRLRIAHLAALIRCGKVIIRDGSLSYPSPRERERVVGSEASKLALDGDANDLGDAKRRPESVGVGGVRKWPPTLAYALLRPSLPTAARGEGLKNDGRAG
jgi:hypothetical protein